MRASPISLSRVASTIHTSTVYTLGVVCEGPLSTSGGAGMGAADCSKGVVLFEQEGRHDVVTWAAAPEVIFQRSTACKASCNDEWMIDGAD